MQALAESLAQHPAAWLAVAGLGAFHGLNPGMGWLLAVSNGLQARRAAAVFRALPPIALGHFLAMGAALLPFALLGVYVERLRDIRIAAGLILVAFGVYKLLSPRHPRVLARIRPAHLTLWSFLIATSHGAGLMLVPVMLDLCGDGAVAGGEAMRDVARGDLALTLNAASLHTIAMVVSGGLVAWIVYRYVGLRFLNRAWVNVDLLWAAMLTLVGAIALAAAY